MALVQAVIVGMLYTIGVMHMTSCLTYSVHLYITPKYAGASLQHVSMELHHATPMHLKLIIVPIACLFVSSWVQLSKAKESMLHAYIGNLATRKEVQSNWQAR